ncbi:MAG: hypothetical protein MUP04_03420, partial [Anaerolineae bacterium]|nr:hypothetical protein [Anaerolineae bacterium]
LSGLDHGARPGRGSDGKHGGIRADDMDRLCAAPLAERRQQAMEHADDELLPFLGVEGAPEARLPAFDEKGNRLEGNRVILATIQIGL